MKRHLYIILFVTLFFFMSLACSFSWDLGGSGAGHVIDVEAGEGWKNTRIKIQEGDVLTITYLSGEWSPWPGEDFDAIGSGGDPRCRCNVIDGVSHAALIGRIGDHDPFLVGERYLHIEGESGFLYLGINDVDLYDNSGSLRVRVEIDQN